MEVGQIVFSKRGRDKGKAFVVMSVSGEYVFLADGRTRPIEKPKKKKFKHVQPTNTVLGLKPAAGGTVKDADIRKWLKEEVSNCQRTTLLK
jgi:ribosomal protein L14E/L6E/L27E